MGKRMSVVMVIGIVFTLFVAVAAAADNGGRFVGTQAASTVSAQKAAANCRWGRLPDRRCTPGATFNVAAARVCVSGYSQRVRHVPESEKRQVEYGIRSVLSYRVWSDGALASAGESFVVGDDAGEAS